MSDITVDAHDVIQNMQYLDERTSKALTIIGDTVGQRMKSHAQLNKPWTTRTGSAKDLLNYGVNWDNTTLVISVYHGVDYGIWLETNRSFQGKYKILDEARNSQVETFKKMVKAMKL